MSFKRVGEGLPGLISQWIDDPELRWGIVVRAWNSAAGEAVARHAEPVSLKDGVLVVRVDDARWRTTLEGLEPELKGALGNALGRDVVRRFEWR